MPPLANLPTAKLTRGTRMGVLRDYLVVAVRLVAYQVAQPAVGGA